mmetsp:Transcript_952/g.1185  ORF Transcript_952/g.1185 Transcript_952/m.1185 type:complete len:404 (-) Transcript_952:578-1789(-)
MDEKEPRKDEVESDSDEESDDEVKEEEEVTDLSNSDVTTKYKEASKIVNLALQGVIQQCTPGARIIDICKFGDSVIEQSCSQIFRSKSKGKAIEKGIAFPTCISVNECVCHNSPLESEEQPPLEAGDMIKIDLGCHIDGYIAVAAQTVVVGEVEAPITGPQADVMHAAYLGAQAALKTMRPGNTNHQVTQAIAKVAASFGVNTVAGTLMHQMKRYVIDGNKVIILREEPEQRVEECTFEPFEVYSIDVAMSTGEGKPRETDTRTTVFKRAVDRNYRLKMRASRYLFNEVNQRFPTMPFSLRALEDERQARMGVVECLKHELLHPYPVLYERAGDHVAHFKFTVLLLQSGTIQVTGFPLPDGQFVTDKAVDEETAALLATSNKKKRKKKKKKNSDAKPAAEEKA